MGDNWEVPKPNLSQAKRLPRAQNMPQNGVLDLIKAASASTQKVSLGSGIDPFEPLKIRNINGDEIGQTDVSSISHYQEDISLANMNVKSAADTSFTTRTFDPTPNLVQPTPAGQDSLGSPSNNDPVMRGAQQDHYSEQSKAQAKALKDEGYVIEGRDSLVVMNADQALEKTIESAKSKDSMPMSSASLQEVKSKFTKSAAKDERLMELNDPSIHPMRAMLRLDYAFGSHEWSSWEWETIALELSRRGVKVPAENVDAIMAIKNLRNSDAFWTNFRAFIAVVVALGNRSVDFSRWNDINVADIASAVDMVSFYIRSRDFSEEVRDLVAGIAIDEGFVVLPEQLSFAQPVFMQELERRIGSEASTWQLKVKSAMSVDIKEFDNLAPDVLAQVARLLRVGFFASTRVQAIQG